MTGQINLNQLIERIIDLEDMIGDEKVFSEVIRRKVEVIKIIILDIKPQKTEYGINWIDAK